MVLMPLIHLSQAALASYGALHSYHAITHLRRYEAPTEHLAQHYSAEAGRQLRETRITQAAAALALAASLAASLYLARRGGTLSFVPRVAAALVLVAALVSARARGARYWGEPRDGDGTKVGEKVGLLPKMGGYNEAQRCTRTVLLTLDWLAYSWVVAAVVGVVRGY